MSFSSDVKEELAKQYSKSRHCQIAELAAIVAMEGQIRLKPLALEFQSENPVLIAKYAILMRKVFDVDITKELTPADSMRVLQTLKISDDLQLFKHAHDVVSLRGIRMNGLLVQKTCCRRAFIRGALLAAGSISNPNKSYHFEIVCHSEEQAKQLQNLMESFEADAKIVLRKNHYVVYIKDGSQIVDMLNVMEAYVSLMNLENVRIIKEMRNTVNRKVNCETANISKTVNAAVRQIQAIEYIRDTVGLDNLPDNLREMALLRLEYPESPLKDLGNYLEPPVGKSGVNHRLRKLTAMAEDLGLELD